MKVNPRALLQAGSIECVHTHYDQTTQDIIEYPAHMTFVTPDVVEQARKLEKGMPGFDPARAANLRFGDVLVVADRGDGKSKADLVLSGKDAAVSVRMSDDTLLPFTGHSMLNAYLKLNEMVERGLQMNQDQMKILTGIRTVFHLICANPDTTRFDAGVIGQAFMSHMLDRPGQIRSSMSDEEISRKMRSDLIRARISRIDPEHEDSLASIIPHAQILQRSGIDTSSRFGAEIRPAAVPNMEEGMRRMIQNNDRLCRDVFGVITGTPVERLGVSVLSCDQADMLIEMNDEALLSGTWVDTVRERTRAELSSIMPGYQFDMDLLSMDGRDLMVIRDQVGSAKGQSFVYSWPTSERIPFQRAQGGSLLNISPEEVPSEGEIARMSAELDRLVSIQEMGNRFDLEGRQSS